MPNDPPRPASKETLAPTQSLLAITTRAEFSRTLLAPPTVYDAAPAALLDAFRDAAPAVEARVRQVTNPDLEAIATRDAAKDARIALQLAAPVGLGLVRTFLISKSLL